MIVQWTLNVEGFGKIEKASVRISPFMIFAGDNNSGKSYIMSLLWGILMFDELEPYNNTNVDSHEAFVKCKQWFLEQKEYDVIELHQMEIEMFIDLFNVYLDALKHKLIKYVFNADIPIQNLYLSDPQSKFSIDIHKHDDDMYSASVTSTKFSIEIPKLIEENDIDFALYHICFQILFFSLTSYDRGAIYLPASRTGFMLTYKALARRAVRRGFQSSEHDDTASLGKLTAPVSRFLSDLIGMNYHTNSPYLQVAEFLEDQVMQGKIEKDHSPVPSYLFKPHDLGQELSLHVTSSLVAELSPIVMYLKSSETLDTLIIEEPEAHLHLDMQRQMARALVRLVNMGLPVWITTHSDTMVQQINNLIKLNNHSAQQELADQYGYQEIDFLCADKVAVYQFNTERNKTEVHLQPLTSNGFSIPTFSESIRKLTKETIDLMENDDNEEVV